MIETDRFSKVQIASLDELHQWLAANHDQTESVWLVRFTKADPARFVDRIAVLDELLCWGWVDGLARKLDGVRTMQLISPRRQQAWAATYKERVARLEREGRMQPSGLAAVAQAKASGTWNSYAEVDALAVPDDLRAELAAVPRAEAWFDAAAPSYRRNVLRWIASARTDTTRHKRIRETVRLAAEGRKVPQM